MFPDLLSGFELLYLSSRRALTQYSWLSLVLNLKMTVLFGWLFWKSMKSGEMPFPHFCTMKSLSWCFEANYCWFLANTSFTKNGASCTSSSSLIISLVDSAIFRFRISSLIFLSSCFYWSQSDFLMTFNLESDESIGALSFNSLIAFSTDSELSNSTNAKPSFAFLRPSYS